MLNLKADEKLDIIKPLRHYNVLGSHIWIGNANGEVIVLTADENKIFKQLAKGKSPYMLLLRNSTEEYLEILVNLISKLLSARFVMQK